MKQIINLNTPVDYETSLHYRNAARTHRGFRKAGTYINGVMGSIPLDANGMPTEDFETLVAANGFGLDLGGTYLLRYPGQGNPSIVLYSGSITFGDIPGRPSRYDPAANETAMLMHAQPGCANIFLKMTETKRLPTDTDPKGTGLAWLELIRPSRTNAADHMDPDGLFNPWLTDAIRYADGTRPMTFLMINGYDGRPVHWDERVKPGDFSVAVRGPLEHALALNRFSAGDYWANCPLGSTRDFRRKWIKALLYGTDGVEPYDGPVDDPVWPGVAPGRVIYAELANEPWNDKFPPPAYYQPIGEGMPDGVGFNYDGACQRDFLEAKARAQAADFVEFSNDLREVAGDAAMGTRILPVIGVFQDGIAWTMTKIAEHLENYYNNGDGHHFDEPHPPSYYAHAFATGGYRGYRENQTEGTAEDIEDVIAQGLTDAYLPLQRAIAKAYGLELVVYEASPAPNKPEGISPFEETLYSDPRSIANVGKIYREARADGIGVYCPFDLTAEPWQLIDHPVENYASDPKWIQFRDECPLYGQIVPVASSTRPFASGDFAGGEATVGASHLLFVDRFAFAAGGYLAAEVAGLQTGDADSLKLIIDGVTVATGAVLRNDLIDRGSGGSSYSLGLGAVIAAGEHSIAIMTTRGLILTPGPATFRLRLQTGPANRTDFETTAFTAFQSSHTCSTTPTAVAYGAEIAMTSAHDATSVFLRIGGYRIGCYYNTFRIITPDGGVPVSIVTVGVSGGFAAARFGGEIRDGAIVATLNGHEVWRAAATAPTPAPAGFEWGGGGASGTLVTAIRQYAIGTGTITTPTDPSLSAGFARLMFELLLGSAS